ncbi:hypothetical protein [Stenotrophomonas hibiscicola]|uniref:hypothetical protein n=1 Tax=Stenotrophomonas hibiscicola TaxID=86189 RepID=UPI001312D669|nr:hypothetical protein [[Pseudomonas] hibiscicola]
MSSATTQKEHKKTAPPLLDKSRISEFKTKSAAIRAWDLIVKEDRLPSIRAAVLFEARQKPDDYPDDRPKGQVSDEGLWFPDLSEMSEEERMLLTAPTLETPKAYFYSCLSIHHCALRYQSSVTDVRAIQLIASLLNITLEQSASRVHQEISKLTRTL